MESAGRALEVSCVRICGFKTDGSSALPSRSHYVAHPKPERAKRSASTRNRETAIHIQSIAARNRATAANIRAIRIYIRATATRSREIGIYSQEIATDILETAADIQEMAVNIEEMASCTLRSAAASE